MQENFCRRFPSHQARNYGERRECFASLRRFFSTLEKCVGRSLKNLALFRKLFTTLVSQAGYGPGSKKKTFNFVLKWYAQRINTNSFQLTAN